MLLAGVGLPVEAVRAQIRSSIDAVVHVARRADGDRTIESIAELAGSSGLRSLYPADEPAVPTRRRRRPETGGAGP